MTPLRLSFACFVAAITLAASPGVTAISRPPIIVAPASDAEFRNLLQPALAAVQAEDCGKALSLLDVLLPRVQGRNRGATQLLRLPCLVSAGRAAEAATVYDELSVSDPQNPMIRNIGVIVALSAGDYVAAGNRLASLAEDDPGSLERVTGGIARGITQALTEKRAFTVRNRLFIALARADWQPQDRPEMRDGLAQGAIDALLEAGRKEEAEGLLPRVTAPELLAGMAMEKHYAALWPAIEARLGTHGVTAIDRYAAQRLDAFANQPDAPEARRDAVRAFVLLGRLPDVNEVARAVPIVAAMSEADVTTIRYDAQALAAQGRIDAAAARLRPFTTLDLAKTPSAASGLVSLAELLDENGHEQDALAIARGTLQRGDGALSGWGIGWLKRTEVCALSALGQTGEANRLADTLKAEANQNQAAAIEGLLCAKRNDEAASLAIATLASAEGAGAIADQFQPERALWAPSASRLRALWAPLLDRADVRAAFEKRARILPQTLWPSREPRPIPRIAHPDDVPVT